MRTLVNIPITEASNLEFVRISDPISHKWAEWEVSFTHDGKPHVGTLGACPRHPYLFHADIIEEAEVDY